MGGGRPCGPEDKFGFSLRIASSTLRSSSDMVSESKSSVSAVTLTTYDLDGGAFCDVLYEAVDMFMPSVIIQNDNKSRVKKTCPPSIRTLCIRKRCVWKQMKHNPADVALCTNNCVRVLESGSRV